MNGRSLSPTSSTPPTRWRIAKSGAAAAGDTAAMAQIAIAANWHHQYKRVSMSLLYERLAGGLTKLVNANEDTLASGRQPRLAFDHLAIRHDRADLVLKQRPFGSATWRHPVGEEDRLDGFLFVIALEGQYRASLEFTAVGIEKARTRLDLQ